MIAPILANLQQQPHRPWRFDSLLEAVKIIEDWRADYNANFYNTGRRHSYLVDISTIDSAAGAAPPLAVASGCVSA